VEILFFRETSLQKDDSKSEGWDPGRYFVEGLGHCGSCHTPRNICGAEEHDNVYAGGVAEGWDAPPLNSNSFAPHKWTADQLTEYLSTGWDRSHGAAAGSMADVTCALVRRRRKMSARWLCTLLAFRLNLEARTMPQRLGRSSHRRVRQNHPNLYWSLRQLSQ
jgi:hypothetical protein